MVRLILTFTLLFSPLALAGTKFRGKVIRAGADAFVADEYTKKSYTLYSSDTETRLQINKLAQGDYIEGVAEQVSAPRIFVESIDFVGLKKILGYWRAKENLFNFMDFNALAVWIVDPHSGFFARKKSYTYSITPGESAEWQIFIADENKAVVSSLDFMANTALLTVYDPETGQAREVITLEKVQN